MLRLVRFFALWRVAVAAPWQALTLQGEPGGMLQFVRDESDRAPPATNLIAFPGGMFPSGAWDSDKRTIGSFYLAETEVTWQLWASVYQYAMKNGYSFAHPGVQGSSSKAGEYEKPYGNEKHPVTFVSWRDAIVWCNALSDMSGRTPVYVDLKHGIVLRNSSDAQAVDAAVHNQKESNGFRLPSEWEWEFAARWRGHDASGEVLKLDGLYWTIGKGYSGANDTTKKQLNSVASRGATTAEVKAAGTPNAMGLYDMTGNIAEWCYGVESKDSLVRKIKGGSRYHSPSYSIIASALGFYPHTYGAGIGFRIAASGTSKGLDYVVAGTSTFTPKRPPAVPNNGAHVGTKTAWQWQDANVLENPNSFPVIKNSLGFVEMEQIQEGVYAASDPYLATDMHSLNLAFTNLFHAGLRGLYHYPANPNSVEGPTAITPKFVAKSVNSMEACEQLGVPFWGFWTFREDLNIRPHLDSHGNFDKSYYDPAYYPPYPDIDARILTKTEIQNFRAGIANSALKQKKKVKLILLLRPNTMLTLLDKALYFPFSNGTRMIDPTTHKRIPDAWKGNPRPLDHKPLPTKTEAQAVLDYIATHFDGVGEEIHIGDDRSSKLFDQRGVESSAALSRWCIDKNLTPFIFWGSNIVTWSYGFDYIKKSYKTLWGHMKAYGVPINHPSMVYFVQAGQPGVVHAPEEIDNPKTSTAFSELGWLSSELAGPQLISV